MSIDAPWLPARVTSRLIPADRPSDALPDLDGPCWEWSGYRNNAGYGKVQVARKSILIHRFTWVSSGRELIAGLSLDHLCRNRSCANPEHLEQVTQAENVRRGATANHARTGKCRNGHDVTLPNAVYTHPNGQSQCRRCQAESSRAWWLANRESELIRLRVVSAKRSAERGRKPHYETTVTHCPQGHPYDEANTYVTPNGHRQCRACRRAPKKESGR